METSTNVSTNVATVDVDIDSWLGAPGADSITVPVGQEEKKPSVLSSPKTDMSFLENNDDDDDDTSKEKTVPRGTENSTNVFDELDEDINETDKKSPGRPKTEKSGLVEFFKKRIESNEMFAFDDYDEKKQSLDEYLGSLSEKDMDELWKANVDNIRQEVAATTPQEFFQSLPDELQYAAKYVADGGQDLKGLFQALAQVEQVRELDPTVESDQEYIVRQYLQVNDFGTPEEIEEEINSWKDINALEKKAKQFKPKLDAMQEQMVMNRLEQQEQLQLQRQQAAREYMQNVFEVLKPAEINGLKLDKKTQAQLYSGLTQYVYPSASGNATNQLGYLLEKYQNNDKNYSLIAEALWLLSDPDGYRSQLQKQGKNEAVEQTVRQLKTEQARKNAAAQQDEEETRVRKISRPTNIFKR
jgi:hypothetical protein